MKRLFIFLIAVNTVFGQFNDVRLDTSGNVVNGYVNFATNGLYVNGVPISPGVGGVGTVQSVNITAPAAGITASGGPITTTGSITLALVNDLAALESLSGTGFAKRTGSDAWTLVTLAESDITNLVSDLAAKELSLGNPGVSGYVLSSTTLGVRSWIPVGTVTGGAGGGTGLTLTGATTLTLGGTLNWASLNKTGSNLTDLVTRNYADLQNIPAIAVQHSITQDGSGLKFVNDLSAPGNNQFYSTDGSGTRGWHTGSAGYDSVFVVASNATNTTQTLANVPDLVTTALSQNTLYEFEADLYCGTSADTSGIQYGVNVTVAPTSIAVSCSGPTVVAADPNLSETLTRETVINNVPIGYFFTTASERGFVCMKGIFKTAGSGSPVFSIQHLKVTSGTSTVFAGSMLKIRNVKSFIGTGL